MKNTHRNGSSLFHSLFLAACIISIPGAARGSGSLVPPCAGSLSVARFRLMVEPAKSGPLLPIQEINILQPGEKLKYEPLHIPPAIRDKAKVAVLLVPVRKVAAKNGEKDKKKGNEPDIMVLEARPAKDTQEWDVTVRTAVVGVVFGPHGLDVKKVTSLVEKNPELIAQLTEYAEQTAKVGALVEALAEYQQSPDGSRGLTAALAGFSSQYNVGIPKLDTTLPANQQAGVLLRAVVPSLQSYDPLTSTPAGTAAQSAGLAGGVATLFFGSPVGLVAGGGALFMNLRTLVFPDSDFRSAFTQPVETNGLALCAKNEAQKPRTRIAYLWMMRVPDVVSPDASLAETAYLPLGGKSTLKVPNSKIADTRLLARAHGWELTSATHHAEVPVKFQAGPADDSLELDLTQTKLPAGNYQLAALWDWEPFHVAGDVELRPLGDFSKAIVTQDSEDHLVEGSGPVKIQLSGADFEFVEKIAIVRAGDKKAAPKEVPFTLPKGKGRGNQESMEAELDTTAWEAGNYRLVLTQENGPARDVPLVIHLPNPHLDNLPLRANLDEPQQTVILRGTNLERITRLTSPDATWELASARPEARELKERKAIVKLLPTAHRDELLAGSMFVQDIQAPIAIAGVVLVAGPRPKITGMSKSLAQQPDVYLGEGEIPAGAATSFSIRAQNLDARPSLSLACANEGFVKQPLILRPGDRTGAAQLDFAGEDTLFLSLDPGVVGQSGCQLSATLSTESAGSSDPSMLGRVIRMPRIEKFALSDEKLNAALYAGTLTGQDLQMIEKTGWDTKTGFAVQGIPTSVPGAPQQQTLKVALPWPPPSPHAPIYVWLRGESAGRLTDVKY